MPELPADLRRLNRAGIRARLRALSVQRRGELRMERGTADA